MEIPYTTEVRPDTGLTNPKLGIWLFLASEVMLFGSLFSAYALLRTGAPSWPDQSAIAQRAARHAEHRGPDCLVGDDGDGVGVAARLGTPAASIRLFMGLTLLVRRHLPRRQGDRVQRQVLASSLPSQRITSSGCISR